MKINKIVKDPNFGIDTNEIYDLAEQLGISVSTFLKRSVTFH